MPQPQTLSQLVTQADQSFNVFSELIATVPDSLVFPLVDRDRNVRDVVGHLIAWHEILFRWYRHTELGLTTAVPAPGYSWAQVAHLNQSIWRALQDTEPGFARLHINHTHQRVKELVRNLSPTELWQTGDALWTRREPVASHFYSLTTIHYQWATNKIRRALRVLEHRAWPPNHTHGSRCDNPQHGG